MYVLGYSGIDGTDIHQQTLYPDADPRLLHFVQGLDSAAVLLFNGEVVAAAAEERFTKVKSTGRFPINAIKFCLSEAGISFDQLSSVAHCFDYSVLEDFFATDVGRMTVYQNLYSPSKQTDLFFDEFTPDKTFRVAPVRHHEAHALSTYDMSGFVDSLVIVSDGMGEIESLSVFQGSTRGLERLGSISASHSLGVLYSLVTYHLGFLPGMDEYKVMGLASHGDPSQFREAFEDLLRFRDDFQYTIPVLTMDRTPREQSLYLNSLTSLRIALGDARAPGAELLAVHMNIAAALQERVELATLRIVKHWVESTGVRNLCLAGGVALNCTANGKILDSAYVDEIFVQPASGDDGAALGAALAESRRMGVVRPVSPLGMPLWGPSYSDSELNRVSTEVKGYDSTPFNSEEELAVFVARKIADGKVLGWFQGAMEFGPRALGNRSIIADPRRSETRDKVNRLIKKREEFRPFAPAVVAENASEYFEIEDGSERAFQHMVVLTRTRPIYADTLAGVTHINGTCRVQTVFRADSPRFWTLLDAVRETIGVPVLLNTSFNVQGQPIVMTPEDALSTAETAGLDGLILGLNYLEPVNVAHADKI